MDDREDALGVAFVPAGEVLLKGVRVQTLPDLFDGFNVDWGNKKITIKREEFFFIRMNCYPVVIKQKNAFRQDHGVLQGGSPRGVPLEGFPHGI